MLFSKETLVDLVYDEHDETKFEILENEIQDSSRWSIHYNLIFKVLETGKIYETGYSVGATESQDESPFEYEGDEIEVTEVEPYEVTVIKYKAVK